MQLFSYFLVKGDIPVTVEIADMSAKIEIPDHVRLFLLDDEGIVFSEAAQQIYALNTSAAFIWCQLELGHDLREITAALERTFRFSRGAAERHVADILDRWRDLGLVAGAKGPKRRSRARREDMDVAVDVAVDARVPPYAAPTFTSERHYTLLNSRVLLRFTSMAQEEWVHPVLAHLETPMVKHADTVVDIVTLGPHHLIYRNEEPVFFSDRLDRLAPMVKGLVWQAGVNGHEYLLNIHAGVVGDGRACILLPAAPGGGKSSLTAGLCHAGFQYFSDEVALLEETTFRIRPMPLSLCFKETAWDVIARFYPKLRELRTHHRGDGNIVRYLPPPSANRPAADKSYPVGLIIFPRYAADASTALKPVGKVETLRRMMDECLVIPAPLDARRIGELVEWIKSVPSYELALSSLDRAVELIRGLREPT